MAYTYRTIGAVTVSTLLAVGTGLLWWQRPASVKPDMPRPQYEAGIMFACLERKVDGGDLTPFLTTIPANVSIRLGGPGAELRIWKCSYDYGDYGVLLSPNDYMLPAGDYLCPFNKRAGITMATGSNPHTGTIYADEPAAPPFWSWYPTRTDLNLYMYTNGYWRTSIMPTSPIWGTRYVFWMSTGTNLPVTLYPYDASDPSNPTPTNSTPYSGDVDVGTFSLAMISYYTNSPAITLTNTIGLFPNATFQYPAAIRGAIAAVGSLRWILPTNTDSTLFDGRFTFPARYLDSDPDYWTNLVTLSTAHRVAQTNYWDGTVITWTNGIAYTNQYASQVSGSSVSAPDSLAGHRSTTNYPYTYETNCWTSKAMAFERDGEPYTWSTNSYNDMARPLALMQWRSRDLTFVGEYRVEVFVDAWNHYGGSTVTTNYNAVSVPYMTILMSEINPDVSYFTYSFGHFSITTNTTPFVRTNGMWNITNLTQEGIPEHWGVDAPSEALLCMTNGFANGWTQFAQDAYADKVDSPTWPNENDLPSVSVLEAWTRAHQQSYDQGTTYIAIGETTYRVVFQSLTNYVNHAPAR